MRLRLVLPGGNASILFPCNKFDRLGTGHMMVQVMKSPLPSRLDQRSSLGATGGRTPTLTFLLAIALSHWGVRLHNG